MLVYEHAHNSALHASYHQANSSDMHPPRNPQRKYKHQHIFIVTGPAGCGKTTVAKRLSALTNMPYLEGDNYHSQSSVEKMSGGIPLTDADRWDWLVKLRELAVMRLASGADGTIVTCSALKKKYRDVIRIARYNDHDVLVHFIYLRAPAEVLMERVNARQGHFMKKDMIQSQLQSLEEPRKERDAHSIDVSGSAEEVEALAYKVVSQLLTDDLETIAPKAT